MLTGTENIGTLEIDEPGPDNPDQRSFIVHVVREGTDRAYTHYLKDGTIDELKEYLLSEEGEKELYDNLHELSDKVDKYWD